MADVKAVYIQIPRELWDRLDQARWTLRTKTDRETYIAVWEIGLKGLETLEKKGKKKP